MPSIRCHRRAALLSLFLFSTGLPSVLAQTNKDFNRLEQSFFFDWNVPGQTFPIPVTEQCETINIVWSRGTATGPNPVPPYHLQVYTSLFLVPVIIPVGMGLSYDWPVPFPPGTMYQICMYDSNGNTGGCQDTYTVIPSSSDAPVTCANATIPPQLDVEGIVSNGPISRYGWIEQCTDIQLTPKNGTPPYTVTIAPALHPPFNISGPGPFNWTVELTWAAPFFIGVSDSAGNMWSHGLLHSGGPGDSSCLGGKSGSAGDTVPVGAVAGAGVGGFIAGALGGLALMYLFTRKRIQRLEREALLDLSGDGHGSRLRSLFKSSQAQYHPVPSHSMGLLASRGSSGHSSSQYRVEPFVMPSEDGRHGGGVGQSPSAINRSVSSDPGSNSRTDKVYVVHHDSHAPPVTIYHENGTEIVELPPRYPEGNQSPPGSRSPNEPARSVSHSHQDTHSDVTGTDSSRPSDVNVPTFLQQPRRPDRPGKPPRRLPSPNTGP